MYSSHCPPEPEYLQNPRLFFGFGINGPALRHNIRIFNPSSAKPQKEGRLGAKCGESDYQIIKKELSAMANNGDYESYNGRRHINFYYETDFARWDFKLNISSVFVNKTPFNPGGSRADQASYMLINKPHFDGYIDTLQELAKADNIMIQAVGYYKNRSKNIQVFPLIGGSITGFLLLECDFSVRIRCSVEF